MALAQQIKSSESKLDPKDERISSLTEENQSLLREKARLEALLDDVLCSQSWKITKPIRVLAKLFRSSFPLFRSSVKTLTLNPGRNVRRDGKRFVLEGVSPSIDLLGNLPSGWVEISADLESDVEHLVFYLYHRSDEGFRETDRFTVAFDCGRVSKSLVKFPPVVKGLRLDPFDVEGAFSFKSLEFKEIGTIQVAIQLLRKQFGPIILHPKLVFRKIYRAMSIVRRSGLAGLKMKVLGVEYANDYQDWLGKYDTLSEKDFSQIAKHIESFSKTPLISVILPTYNTPEKWLRKAIESVQSQLYPNWELCVADDASTEPQVRKVLEEYAASDSRIKLSFREENGHISLASNSALELATGEYVSFLDHDDELREHALYMVAAEINQHPDLAIVYSDEDKISTTGLRSLPYFKSDWNPELIRAQNFVTHLATYRRDLVDSVGGLRQGFEGAQDWDLLLRCSEQVEPDLIRHIPHVLYHWRTIEGSTAQSTSFKLYALDAQKKAVEEHLQRIGLNGSSVEVREDIAHLRVRYPVPQPEPKVSLIIPTRDALRHLKTGIESILADTKYSNYEIVVVDNDSREAETLEYLKEIETNSKVQVIRDEQPFNFSRLNNSAVAATDGEVIGFLNNDLSVISPDWLSEMVSHVVQRDVGAVGARLLYPNNVVQHAGTILGIGGIAGHNHKGIAGHDPGNWNRAILPQNLSAVTAACILTRREVFEEVGGFNEKELSVALNDVDWCLRVREKGYLVTYTPYAELYHYESASRGHENTPQKFFRFEGEIEYMRERWGKDLSCDPYYNPNLSLLREDFSLAYPSRAEKPWLACEGNNGRKRL